MEIKKLLSLLFILIISPSILAQTGKINGTVTDQNGEPLPGVNIQIEGTLKGASTDVDGFYTILNVLPGTYTIRATYIGFASVRVQDVEVNVNLTTTVDFELSEETIEGEEIVVVAERPVIKKDVAASVANINTEDIESLPITSVTSAVGLQAGIQGLSVRGSGNDEVAINFNGLNLTSGRTNTPRTGISLTSIQNVQVQTGGFNAEFGEVRSGLITVTTKEGERDRYTLDGLVRVTPPQAKNFGQSVNSPNSYWLRPYLDDDVAWTGTTNGAWDSYTQSEFPTFKGWNAVSEELLADSDPGNDLSPEGAQQLFLWQHRKKTDIDESDYELDFTFGGPVPVISERFGDLRFSTSLRETKEHYFIPLSEENFTGRTVQWKLTSNVAPGMKLSIDGYHDRLSGTGESQVGNPGFFTSAYDIARFMDNVSFIDTRIFASDYWAPREEKTDVFGLKFTHSLSDNTFYEVRVSHSSNRYDSNPGAFRDTSNVITIGGLPFDEGPFGFFDDQSSGVGSGMRMGIGMSTSRDTSKISDLLVTAEITSQLNRVNQVKAGFEFVRTRSEVNYGSFDKNFPSGRFITNWDTTPIRFAAFVQNKLEFNGMIANVGLRVTYADPNLDWFNFDTFDDVFIPGNAGRLDTLSTSRADAQLVVMPRLSASFPITDNSKLFFNYGHFLQLPTPENLYRIQVEPFSNTIVSLGAPENDLPKTVQYELGFEQSILDQYLIRINGYYKDASQQPRTVTYNGRNGQSYNIRQPFSYADTRGLELTFRKQPSRIFWGEINYTYSIVSAGLFGTLQIFENPFEQREYERTTGINDVARPVPRPFARMQLFLRSPEGFGPELFGTKPFANWNLSSIIAWQAGLYTTYTGGGSVPGIQNNLQTRDFWDTELRLNKNIRLGNNRSVQFFVDISNVINRKEMDIRNMGSVDGVDFQAYMRSLHLPAEKWEEIGLLNSSVPGSDKPGDYRAPGVEFVPIEVTVDINNVSNPNTRALYYNSIEAKYYQFVDGSFVEADQGFVNKVLDEKAYINMPNQRYFNFFNPRTYRLGVRFSF